MFAFFQYNWQVRDEWLDWCKQLSAEELLKERVGGPGSILYTLFHIIDVEYSWVRAIQGKEDVLLSFSEYNTLQQVKNLSETCRCDIEDFLLTCTGTTKNKLVRVPWEDEPYTSSEILHHVIAHEIHHIGQLSIWSRELKLKPVSAHFVGRGLL